MIHVFLFFFYTDVYLKKIYSIIVLLSETFNFLKEIIGDNDTNMCSFLCKPLSK